MGLSAVHPSRQRADFPEGSIWNLSPKGSAFLEAIVQIAVRIFFVFSVILMTALILPASFSAVVLPLLGIGAATLSSFFFQLDTSVSQDPIEHEVSLILPNKEIGDQDSTPVQVLPIRGLFRDGMNCSINSDVQWMDCDPLVVAWSRKAIPEDLEQFVEYLEEYDLPPDWIFQFRNYLPGLNPPLPIPVAFEQFLQRIDPGEANPPWKNFYLQFRAIYRDLLILQPSFSSFMRTYDQAIQQNLPIATGNSQCLRENVLSRLSPQISSDSTVQIDAAEGITKILDLLPNRQKIHIRECNYYRVDGVTPMLNNAQGMTEKERYQWGIQLEINKNIPQNELVQMFKSHCNEQCHVPDQNDWVEHVNDRNESQRYQPIQRVFHILEHPTALRFQIKRFESIRPTLNWFTKLLPSWWPGMGWRCEKLHNPIQIPPLFPLAREDGMEQNYQLAAFIVHIGDTPNSGHYVAYRKLIVNGESAYFRMDDHVITQIDQPEWERASAQAYLIYYLKE